MRNLKAVKLHPEAKLPTKAHATDAGIDIYACLDGRPILMAAGVTQLIDTGIALVLPEGYCLKLADRSSFGSKGISVRAGVIDQDYRGEIKVALGNDNYYQFLLLTDELKQDVKDATHLSLESGKLIKFDGTEEEEKDALDNQELIRVENLIVKHTEDPIAQGLLIEVPKVSIEELTIDEFTKLADTERAAGGFGSTNA